jgi:hypothetical protein
MRVTRVSVRRKEENVPKTTISFGRPEPMAINSVNRGIDDDNRVSDVFPWICWRENHSKQRIEIVD